MIARQVRDVGLTQPLVAIGSVYSPKFIELGGPAAEGVYTESNFFPGDTRPEVQEFVRKFKAKYGEEPDDFNAVAYDTIILLADVMNKYGDRAEADPRWACRHQGRAERHLRQGDFDPQTRRVKGARAVYLVVKNGVFTLWDGKKPGG